MSARGDIAATSNSSVAGENADMSGDGRTESQYARADDDQFARFLARNVVPLKEVEEAPFNDFSVVCPVCGETVMRMSTDEVLEFGSVCPECGTTLHLGNAVAISDSDSAWTADDDPDTDETLTYGRGRRKSLTPEDYQKVIPSDAIPESTTGDREQERCQTTR